jgi:cytochrome b
MSKKTSSEPDPGETHVWDIFVRVFHWALALSIGVAALTGFVLGAVWIRLHIAAAVLALALVVARLVWGFLGPTFARFSNFVELRPSKLLHHVGELRANSAPRYVGHNPLGGVMVVALIATILALGLTGTGALGGLLKTGPFVDELPYQFGKISNLVHYGLSFFLLLLVVLHVGGVVFESLRTDENLARVMLTGRKARLPGDVVVSEKTARPMRAAIMIAVLLIGVGAMALESSREKPTSPPIAQADFDPTFTEECSACHMLYHPSLLPAEHWRHLMAGLDNHFGEDASLDQATTTRIRDWLIAHAAETADTRPANLFRPQIGADGVMPSISSTAAWRSLHDEALESGAFEVKSVGSRDNCAACHKDAEAGWFSPFSVNVPKE